MKTATQVKFWFITRRKLRHPSLNCPLPSSNNSMNGNEGQIKLGSWRPCRAAQLPINIRPPIISTPAISHLLAQEREKSTCFVQQAGLKGRMEAKSGVLLPVIWFLVVGHLRSFTYGEETLGSKCVNDISNLMKCQNNATGSKDSPSDDCCSAVRERSSDPVCLCYTIQQVGNGTPPFSKLNLQVDTASTPSPLRNHQFKC